MGWLLVILGGIVEIFWVSGLKYANSFWLYCLTFLGILISFCLMILATKKLEVSVAYAVFVGIGSAGIVIAEMLVFGESIDFVRIILISTLLFGVIGLKLTSKSKSEQKITQDIATELGLDNLMQDQNTQTKEHTC
ncbi:DMT family transporter [Helicobacter equorum]|uniref:DMT family transporter n=1 Tax=Helicobacter equorum TaxID=361872 RepID=UPI000CF04CC5|nr:multidrug efflux SMR transporter [Helicobacter equorum]